MLPARSDIGSVTIILSGVDAGSRLVAMSISVDRYRSTKVEG
jgi:hypothetical protein